MRLLVDAAVLKEVLRVAAQSVERCTITLDAEESQMVIMGCKPLNSLYMQFDIAAAILDDTGPQYVVVSVRPLMSIVSSCDGQYIELVILEEMFRINERSTGDIQPLSSFILRHFDDTPPEVPTRIAHHTLAHIEAPNNVLRSSIDHCCSASVNADRTPLIITFAEGNIMRMTVQTSIASALVTLKTGDSVVRRTRRRRRLMKCGKQADGNITVEVQKPCQVAVTLAELDMLIRHADHMSNSVELAIIEYDEELLHDCPESSRDALTHLQLRFSIWTMQRQVGNGIVIISPVVVE